ncbi:MAG: DUF1161 domain-containing protein [Proteobacteria bacterium]|nr:DUF1161 domain-containing protein [Pseudomonadota bacterium]
MTRSILIGCAFALAASPALAERKACEVLKAEIEARIKSHGVAKFSLEIVAPDAVGDRKVVGSCDGNTKRIVYTRG